MINKKDCKAFYEKAKAIIKEYPNTTGPHNVDKQFILETEYGKVAVAVTNILSTDYYADFIFIDQEGITEYLPIEEIKFSNYHPTHWHRGDIRGKDMNEVLSKLETVLEKIQLVETMEVIEPEVIELPKPSFTINLWTDNLHKVMDLNGLAG